MTIHIGFQDTEHKVMSQDDYQWQCTHVYKTCKYECKQFAFDLQAIQATIMYIHMCTQWWENTDCTYISILVISTPQMAAAALTTSYMYSVQQIKSHCVKLMTDDQVWWSITPYCHMLAGLPVIISLRSQNR